MESQEDEQALNATGRECFWIDPSSWRTIRNYG
jgi:hypothetical protein